MTEGDIADVRNTEDSSAQLPIQGLPMELVIELDSEGSGYVSTDSKGGGEKCWVAEVWTFIMRLVLSSYS